MSRSRLAIDVNTFAPPFDCPPGNKSKEKARHKNDQNGACRSFLAWPPSPFRLPDPDPFRRYPFSLESPSID